MISLLPPRANLPTEDYIEEVREVSPEGYWPPNQLTLRHTALDVYDFLHLFGPRVRWASWAPRFGAKSGSEDSSRRRWERLKQNLRRSHCPCRIAVVAANRGWDLIFDEDSQAWCNTVLDWFEREWVYRNRINRMSNTGRELRAEGLRRNLYLLEIWQNWRYYAAEGRLDDMAFLGGIKEGLKW